ncbi:hypothetical protein BC628DRAFT_1324629 [Trametes gibbosa]|nr:hypothetical protein BC628DRAFT_1324629 [Trametes gibbosa]
MLRTVPLPPCGRPYREPTPPPKRTRAASPALPTPALRPWVDPLLACTHNAAPGSLDLGWDLMQNPRTLFSPDGTLLSSCSWVSTAWCDLAARCAARADHYGGSGKPLRSLVLVFRYLPLQIEIKPSRRRRPSASDSEAAYVSVWDVLAGLYDGLRAPVDPTVYNSMSRADQEILRRCAAQRVGLLRESDRGPPGLGGGLGRAVSLRKIDFLRQRRRFVGIRAAEGDEIPKGRRFGEVFVVEVDRSC